MGNQSFPTTRLTFIQKGKVDNNDHLCSLAFGYSASARTVRVPTAAATMSQSSHHSRKSDILLASNRSPTATSGRTKKMLNIAYILGAWLSWRASVSVAMLSEDQPGDFRGPES